MSDDSPADGTPAPVESRCEWCRQLFAEDLPDRFCSMRCEQAWAAWRAANVPAVQGDRIPF